MAWNWARQIMKTRGTKERRGPSWSSPDRADHKPVLPTGTQNHNGQSVFSVAPVEGLMHPGKAQEFTVTFSPDHESLYFSDLLQVVLFEKVKHIAGPSQIPSHSGRDSCVSLICP